MPCFASPLCLLRCLVSLQVSRFKERDDNVKHEILKATRDLLKEAVVAGTWLCSPIHRSFCPVRDS